MENVDPIMGILVPYFNFALFLAAAIYFFRKPVAAAAAKKKNEFVAAKELAQKAKIEAEQALAKLEQRLASLQTEIDDIKATAKKSAEVEAERIVKNAAELASHLKEEAKRLANYEVEKAKQGLRDEVMTQVMKTVTGRLQTELSGTDQARLVEARIAALKGVHASS